MIRNIFALSVHLCGNAVEVREGDKVRQRRAYRDLVEAYDAYADELFALVEMRARALDIVSPNRFAVGVAS